MAKIQRRERTVASEQASAAEKYRSREAEEDEYEDDDDEESSGSTAPKVEGGWGAWKKSKKGDFLDDLKVTDEAILIAFQQDAPYAAYRQHWVEGLRSTKKKSFICIEDDCPLCEDLGDNPRAIAEFNVIDLSGMAPSAAVWKVGVRVGGQLENLHAKQGPLTDFYWSVSKSGKGSATTYSIQKVKERDLEEDWGVQPLTTEQRKACSKKMNGANSVHRTPRAELREIAEEAAEG